MRPPTRYWTEEDLTIAVRMRNRGATYDAIAAKIGRSAASVSIRMARLRVVDFPVMVAADITKWTPERDDKLMAMWNQTVSTLTIAEKLGTTRKAIRARIQVLRRTRPWVERRKREYAR